MPDPRRDEKALTHLRRMLRHPQSVKDIQAKFHAADDGRTPSESTVYRWFRYLEDRGVTVVRRGPRGAIRFSVAQ